MLNRAKRMAAFCFVFVCRRREHLVRQFTHKLSNFAKYKTFVEFMYRNFSFSLDKSKRHLFSLFATIFGWAISSICKCQNYIEPRQVHKRSLINWILWNCRIARGRNEPINTKSTENENKQPTNERERKKNCKHTFSSLPLSPSASFVLCEARDCDREGQSFCYF